LLVIASGMMTSMPLAVTGNPVLVDNNTNVEMYIQSVDNSRNITKNRQENVDQQIGTTAALRDC
jgi:hypothetical protein